MKTAEPLCLEQAVTKVKLALNLTHSEKDHEQF